ncbi:HAD family hydrolase [Octadecabacter ascidiaceicola]|uniref:Alpha-D-glucose-1-phosphate phosphatase YihX n=1 Tax=Octadecabacter ascidiaceicola TaxID=1655543 RepID=A0A238KB02_9RHOB|nr:HAD family phosphatase [Octadecabacter ascidiaceicola]SMX40033.1 Alpha-D-glucose-1-phosphate phosphatase YihX [Octadecabacter ascidiaceicola]
MTVQAIVFDIGNVLIEWQPERFFDRVIGAERSAEFFAAIQLHEMNDRVDAGEVFHDVIAETIAQNPDWADELTLWRDRWIEMASPVIDHSVRLLRALRRAGHPVYALSNFGNETFAIAEPEYPFLEEFDKRYISGALQIIKPAAAIYEHVENDSGIAPGGLLFVDDRHDNIAAADARGWKTHLFEGPTGWAERLVQEGLLTPEAAQ